MSDLTVKRGDTATFTLGLGVDLSDYEAAAVLLRPAGGELIQVTGTIDDGTDGTVSVTLAPDDTAIVGDYRLEVEMTPGPHTYPSTGWLILSVVDDLNGD